ncbi:hypothetical protein [Flavobacterium sp.]
MENFGKNHFSDAEKLQFDNAINAITTIILAKTYNLTPKERSKFGKIGEKKKLLIDKIKEYHQNVPALQSPDVDWDEFEADYTTRYFSEQKILQLQ